MGILNSNELILDRMGKERRFSVLQLRLKQKQFLEVLSPTKKDRFMSNKQGFLGQEMHDAHSFREFQFNSKGGGGSSHNFDENINEED